MYYNLHVYTFTLAPVYIFRNFTTFLHIPTNVFVFLFYSLLHLKDNPQRISSKETYQGTKSQQTP